MLIVQFPTIIFGPPLKQVKYWDTNTKNKVKEREWLIVHAQFFPIMILWIQPRTWWNGETKQMIHYMATHRPLHVKTPQIPTQNMGYWEWRRVQTNDETNFIRWPIQSDSNTHINTHTVQRAAVLLKWRISTPFLIIYHFPFKPTLIQI